ncbi:hypothetical protein BDY19DRAFT_909416 [Irpex rosettiformis]|uniref:Uncharacterized protein n=1 Tax=Irpex rosettiformis TaxID=378272 RepID=A0ACB8TSZ6_9APHY|nr:hypothetical protein BDY19DRAFT_909416 [Irpex rosettiformis]
MSFLAPCKFTIGNWSAPGPSDYNSNYRHGKLAPRFYGASEHFQTFWNAQINEPHLPEMANYNAYDTVVPESDALPWPPVLTKPRVVSPRPVYAYSFLPSIEGAITRFDSPNSTASTQSSTATIPPWKLPCPDTLDGIPGHVGIVEHGPKLGGYRDLYTPLGFSHYDYVEDNTKNEKNKKIPTTMPIYDSAPLDEGEDVRKNEKFREMIQIMIGGFKTSC